MIGLGSLMIGGGQAGDPYWASVMMLVQPKAGDGSLIDYAPSPRTIANFGTGLTGSIWGGRQGVSFASGNYFTAAGMPATNQGDWCYEFVYTATGSAAWMSGSTATNVPSGFNTHGTMGAANFQKTTDPALNFGNFVPASNTPIHCACVRVGGNWYFYQNGVLRSPSGTNSGGEMASPSTLYCGRTTDTNNGLFVGTLHAVRLTYSSRGYGGSTIPNAVTAGPFPYGPA